MLETDELRITVASVRLGAVSTLVLAFIGLAYYGLILALAFSGLLYPLRGAIASGWS